MLNGINMEFIPAFNPLYAVPIVAVVFCAFIVYAFGFKSPVPPPSFDGIDEDKKYSKKRKSKETQKQNKVITNGRLNGVPTNKGKHLETGKKDSSEKHIVNDKSSNNEKNAEKKAAKKAKLQSDKKLPQEEKKENVSHDDMNDDGWVQLVSKKGRKSRRKDDSTDIQSDAAKSTKPVELNKSDVNSEVDQSPKKIVELLIDESTEETNQVVQVKPLKEVTKKDAALLPSPNKAVDQNVTIEVKSDKNAEKAPKKATVPKVLEETSKSKKKKKKTPPVSENENANNIDASVETVSQTPPQGNIESIAPATLEIPMAIPDKVEANSSAEIKSNIVFDELAGLYPETKEKKKKKVRRDH